MPSSWRADPFRLVGLLPAVLAAVAEGAWIAVIYAALESGRGPGQSAPLGILAFAFTAAAGIVVARTRIMDRDLIITGALVATLVFGVLGWLADPAAREALTSVGLAAGLNLHLGGWSLGVAFWRGLCHPDPAFDDSVMAGVLRWGVLAVAVPWLAIRLGPEAGRNLFTADAFGPTLLFVAAGLLALGLARLRALLEPAGVDWRRNRSWLVTTLMVVAIVGAIGVPAAFLLGQPVLAVLAVVLWPVLFVAGLVAVVVGLAVSTFAHYLAPVLTPILPRIQLPQPPAAPSPSAGLHPTLPVPGEPPIPIPVLLTLVVVAAGAIVLWRMLKAARPVRLSAISARPLEERSIALPRLSIRAPRLAFRSPFPEPRPTTASEAYLGVLRRLAGDDDLRRLPAESPAAHADRTGSRLADPAVRRLAADFQLERYGGARLTTAETRRALERWRRFRRRA